MSHSGVLVCFRLWTKVVQSGKGLPPLRRDDFLPQQECSAVGKPANPMRSLCRLMEPMFLDVGFRRARVTPSG
jgi:hypothetical protein